MKIVRLTENNLPLYQQELWVLESKIEYSLGQDSFFISHDRNYLLFFKNLGTPYAYLVIHKDTVVATAAAVLRTLNGKSTWYLCDLKVCPNFRGRHLALKIFKRYFIGKYLRCSRGFAIVMKSGNDSGKSIRILQRIKFLNFGNPLNLNLYFLNHLEVMQYRKSIESAKGTLKVKDWGKSKQLILKSTGKPMSLTHLVFDNSGNDPEFREGVTYCMAISDTDPLNKVLNDLGVFPSSKAEILSHRMKVEDFNQLSSWDI